MHMWPSFNKYFCSPLSSFVFSFLRYQKMTERPLCDPNTVHRFGEDLITYLQIIYPYIHWEQEKSTMNDIKELLYAINKCLTLSYNTYFCTDFSRFRPFLPSRVNVLRAQLHRNVNLVYYINRKIDVFQIPKKIYIHVSIQLLLILQHVKHFVAVKLTTAKAK